MKILWIPHTAWHIPQRAHVFARLLAREHEVHVTDAVADFNRLRDYASWRYARNFFYRYEQHGRIHVHGVPRFSPALFVPTLRRLNARVFSQIVRGIIDRHQIDAVVGTYLVPPPQAPRVVFDLFDDNVAFWRSRGRVPGYADDIARTERRYLRRADAVVAASSVLRDRAIALGARQPVHLIPNGVDLCAFRLARPHRMRRRLGVDGPLVGSVANHDSQAEMDKLLDAARLIKGDGITMLIAGRGVAIEHARWRVRTEGLSNVRFYGYVSAAEAPSVISALDVGLCSYQKSTMDDARSPMRLIMYAAAGVPSVCTDLEEVRRMDFPNVVRVQDNAAALAEGIRRALSLERGRPAGFEDDYGIDQLARRYEQVLTG